MPQYISKLILNGVTQMDVTQDTVAANNLLSGETATGADGAPVVGAYVPTTSALIVTVSWDDMEGKWMPDTSLANIRTAYQGGRDIAVQSDTPGGDVVASGNYDDEHDWFVYTVRASMGGPIYEWNYRLTSGGIIEVSNREAIVPNFETVSKTYTPTMSAQTETVTFDSDNYNGLQQVNVTVNAMPSGSATPPTTISGSSATLTTGTNTITLQKTLSVTPQVSAGYVSSGTAGNSSVSLTANVTTKAAATITPGTTNQTIASGTYLTGTQTISGDANLVAGNIKSGTTIFGVTGTYSGGGGTLTVATKTATLSAVGQTLSFTGLLGTPKYWFVKTTSQISSSGSTTIYYITDGFWDGTSVKGNSFRIGSTRRIYSWTSGVTQSYSGGTLTITGGSGTGSSPGQFFNGNYELTYVY